jgi:hypothetical protein
MPVLTTGTALDVYCIGSKGSSQWNVEADIANGMALSQVTMGADGTFSRSNNIDSRESLIPINNALWLAIS